MKTSPLLHIVRLAKRLNNAAAKEAKPTFSLLEVITELKTFGEFAVKLSLFIGVILVFAYLIFSVNFYPAGLTLADTVFFLMAAMAFGFVYVVCMMGGFSLASLLWPRVQRRYKQAAAATAGLAPKRKQRILIVAAIVLLVAMIYFPAIPKLINNKFSHAFVGFVFAGVLLHELVTQLDKRRSAIARSSTGTPAPLSANAIKTIVLFALLLPALFSASFLKSVNEDFALIKIGLRATQVTLKLSEENYGIVASGAGGQYLAALGCSVSPASTDRLVHDVNLLWHGVGERSLVEIPNPNGEPIIVELKREGVFLIKKYAGLKERCLDLNGDLLFGVGSAELDESSDNEDLRQMVDVIKKLKAQIEEINVIGHSDPLPFANSPTSNDILATKRAQVIAEFIQKNAGLAAAQVKPTGHGAREPKTLCKDWPVKASLGECLAANRRVEVRIKFKSTSSPVTSPKTEA